MSDASANKNDLVSSTPKVLEVKPEIMPVDSKIGTQEFVEKLLNEFTGKHAWRTSSKLAQKLGVSIEDLEKFLDKDKRFMRQVDDKGNVLYAIVKRVKEDSDKQTKEVAKQKSIHKSEYMSLAMVAMLEKNLFLLIKNHGTDIYERNEESLAHLTRARKSLQFVKTMLANELQVNVNDII